MTDTMRTSLGLLDQVWSKWMGCGQTAAQRATLAEVARVLVPEEPLSVDSRIRWRTTCRRRSGCGPASTGRVRALPVFCLNSFRLMRGSCTQPGVRPARRLAGLRSRRGPAPRCTQRCGSRRSQHRSRLAGKDHGRGTPSRIRRSFPRSTCVLCAGCSLRIPAASMLGFAYGRGGAGFMGRCSGSSRPPRIIHRQPGAPPRSTSSPAYPPEILRGPKVRMPDIDRSYLLFEGPIDAAGELGGWVDWGVAGHGG
jgi:hypothetical protein